MIERLKSVFLFFQSIEYWLRDNYLEIERAFSHVVLVLVGIFVITLTVLFFRYEKYLGHLVEQYFSNPVFKAEVKRAVLEMNK